MQKRLSDSVWYNLNLATGKFGVYAYLPDMRGTGAADVYIVQGSGNKADSVELQVPKGSKYEEIILMECDLQNT